MNTIGHLFGLTKATEVLVVTLIGICCTIFDASILDLNTNLGKVWSVYFDPEKFSRNSQTFIKYLLSGIVLVRTFSVHLYLAFYIVMLWPAVFEERPNLLLPWLTVGAVKSLGMGFLAFSAGMYACFVYGAWRPACIDFFFAQIIDNAPSMYAWIIVLSYYRDLKLMAVGGLEKNLDKTNNIPDELVIRRRMTRSINADPLIDNKNENFSNRIRSETITPESRSLDSLLVKISNDGYVEENASSEVFAPSDEDPEVVNYVQRTIKVLDITDSDIQRAKMQQRNRCPLPSSGDLLQLLESNVQKRKRHESTSLNQDRNLQCNSLDGAEVANKIDGDEERIIGYVKKLQEAEDIRQTESKDFESGGTEVEVNKGMRKVNGVLERRRPIEKRNTEQCNEEGTKEKLLKKENKKSSRLSFSETFSYDISRFSLQDSEYEQKTNSNKVMLADESEIYTTTYERDSPLSTPEIKTFEHEVYGSSIMHSACCSKIIQPIDGITCLSLEGKFYTTSSGHSKLEEIVHKTGTKKMRFPSDFPTKLNRDESSKLRRTNNLLRKYVNDGYTQDYLMKRCKTNVLNEEIVSE